MRVFFIALQVRIVAYLPCYPKGPNSVASPAGPEMDKISHQRISCDVYEFAHHR